MYDLEQEKMDLMKMKRINVVTPNVNTTDIISTDVGGGRTVKKILQEPMKKRIAEMINEKCILIGNPTAVEMSYNRFLESITPKEKPHPTTRKFIESILKDNHNIIRHRTKNRDCLTNIIEK